MRTLILTSLVLALAACTPMPPATSTPGQSATADAAACRERGGTLRPVGRMQSLQCVVPYADAGKVCTDGDQCAGDCRAAPDANFDAPGPISGFCQADSDRFGCVTTLEDGKVASAMCID